MGSAPFSSPPPRRVTSPTDSLVHVESLCMHARTAQVEEYACDADGRTNSSPSLGLIENVGSGARMRALHVGRSLMRECRGR